MIRRRRRKQLDQNLTSIMESISGRAQGYFADFSDGKVTVSVDNLRHLKNSTICDFRLEQEDRERSVVVKTSPVGGLTNILKIRVGEEFIYEREFRVLHKTFEHLAQASARLKAVRPLDLLEAPPSIVTEKVTGIGYQKLFRKGGRFGSEQACAAARQACELAAEWLWHFHQADIEPVDSRQEKWSDPMKPFEETLSGLAGSVEDERLLEQIREKAHSKVAGRKLDGEEEFTVTHGDFALRNLMWLKDGSVAVFDTLALHVEPVYLDLAYFITSLRTYWLNLVTLGTFFSPSLLEDYESAFVARYREGRTIDPALLDFFVLYAMLDKWKAGFIHLESSETGFSKKRRKVKQKLLEHLIRREVIGNGS